MKTSTTYILAILSFEVFCFCFLFVLALSCFFFADIQHALPSFRMPMKSVLSLLDTVVVADIRSYIQATEEYDEFLRREKEKEVREREDEVTEAIGLV